MPSPRQHVPEPPVPSDANATPPPDTGSAQAAPVLLLLPGRGERAPDVDSSSAGQPRSKTARGETSAHGSQQRPREGTQRTAGGQRTVRAALSRPACSQVASLAYELLHAAEEAERDHSTERAAAVLRLLLLLAQTAGACLRGEELPAEAILGAQAGGSLRQAARLLGVPRSTLHDRLRRARGVPVDRRGP